MKFVSFVLFALLWTTFVYDPVAHWVWSTDGWIRHLGGLDFGGGLVIHLTAGLAALCCALALGQRKGLDHEDLHPHNLTLTALGTALLWFGWLGLDVGQARGQHGGGGGICGDRYRGLCGHPGMDGSGVFSETEGNHARARAPEQLPGSWP